MRQALILLAVACTAVVTAASVSAADSPACAAAKKRIAYDNAEITKANKNKNFGTQSAVRTRQLDTRIARLRADLILANAAKTKACGADVSAYDGTYSGIFPGTTITITFTVTNGAVSGDLTNTPPLKNLDPTTGNVYVKANFLDADCGTPLLHFNLAAKTATGKNVTCKLSGLSRTGDFVARK